MSFIYSGKVKLSKYISSMCKVGVYLSITVSFLCSSGSCLLKPTAVTPQSVVCKDHTALAHNTQDEEYTTVWKNNDLLLAAWHPSNIQYVSHWHPSNIQSVSHRLPTKEYLSHILATKCVPSTAQSASCWHPNNIQSVCHWHPRNTVSRWHPSNIQNVSHWHPTTYNVYLIDIIATYKVGLTDILDSYK